MALVTNTIDLDSPDDVALADRMKTGRDRIIAELRKAIVGQEDVVNQVLLTLFTGGNSLIVGVPGLATYEELMALENIMEGAVVTVEQTESRPPLERTPAVGGLY